ncbi:MAG: ABC transporter substrate-binding protein, partial [Alphaproteobacteria bacterium]
MMRSFLLAVRFAAVGLFSALPGVAAAADGQAYPIVLKNALGTADITKKPVRVATVAWANHEVPLALGIVPVGF